MAGWVGNVITLVDQWMNSMCVTTVAMEKKAKCKVARSLVMLILFCLSVNSASVAEELLIRHIRPEGVLDKRSDYYIALLTLALEKTQVKYGEFHLEMNEKSMLQARALLSVAKKQFIDVVWTMTSKDREAALLPVRIPLLKGLLGYRIFIIKKQDKGKFGRVQTLEGLSELVAGQGLDWPDVSILRANDLTVVVGASYDGLFRMLSAGRFDYFPRGMNEPRREVKAHKGRGFIVEDSLLLKYPAPIYFFVHKANTVLAKRIKEGLLLAIQDGSFDSLFYEHPANKGIFKLTNIKNRKVFELRNPLLPAETPLDDHRLWHLP
mgnify:CR=1 FL=1